MKIESQSSSHQNDNDQLRERSAWQRYLERFAEIEIEDPNFKRFLIKLLMVGAVMVGICLCLLSVSVTVPSGEKQTVLQVLLPR